MSWRVHIRDVCCSTGPPAPGSLPSADPQVTAGGGHTPNRYCGLPRVGITVQDTMAKTPHEVAIGMRGSRQAWGRILRDLCSVCGKTRDKLYIMPCRFDF